MDCPVCESPMKEIERYGVDIDICPECKGDWRMLNYVNVCKIVIS
ncbi:MAG: Zn-finger domain-containing nucleic acid-binding protein [Candidatus Methanocomedens sp.]|nr:MAG: Zn-finger domain-containing nucleic acid-binding protein [ANME-2 cluster archaeon]